MSRVFVLVFTKNICKQTKISRVCINTVCKIPVLSYYIKGDIEMSTKTDLAKEIIDKISPDYAKKRSFFFKSTEISEVLVETEEESALFEKPKGRYITVETDFPRFAFEKFDEEALAAAFEISKMLPKSGDVLAVGIGNALLTADSLGPLVSENLLAGEFFGRKLFSTVPGVFGRTGIEPEAFVFALAKKLSPSAVIIIDSLAAEEISHVCRSVQICDSGISPGSGFGKAKAEISAATLGIPVIAVGTPTVTNIGEADFVSPNNIDFLVKRAAKLIACAVSLAVFPKAGIDFIKGIIL